MESKSSNKFLDVNCLSAHLLINLETILDDKAKVENSANSVELDKNDIFTYNRFILFSSSSENIITIRKWSEQYFGLELISSYERIDYCE